MGGLRVVEPISKTNTAYHEKDKESSIPQKGGQVGDGEFKKILEELNK